MEALAWLRGGQVRQRAMLPVAAREMLLTRVTPVQFGPKAHSCSLAAGLSAALWCWESCWCVQGQVAHEGVLLATHQASV